MRITIIIILLTFIYSILDKFIFDGKHNEDKNGKTNLFYKTIKSKYTLIVLLSSLLAFQVISEFSSSEAEKIRETKTANAYDTLYVTHENVKKVNSSVESLFSSIDSTIGITKEQLKLISNVNNDLEEVRQGFNASITEFRSIKEQYEKQIKLEKEKIKEAKPNLEVAYAKYNIDTINFGYSFELYNSGIRLADSIIYHSLIILVDSSSVLRDICLYKTNIDEANILSISHLDNFSNSRIFNSETIETNKLSAFSRAYLLLAYKYKDNMTNMSKNNFLIYRSSYLEKGNKQLGTNIKEFEKETIKIHLLKNNKKLYEIFYN